MQDSQHGGKSNLKKYNHLKINKEAEKRLKALIKKMSKAYKVAVGVLQNEPLQENSQAKAKPNFTMVDLATVHEFGSKDGHIPKRSFIRSTCDAKAKEYLDIMGKLQGRCFDGKYTLRQSSGVLGNKISKDIVLAVNSGLMPPLKQSTIKRKKSSKPLIDTGVLKGCISYEVRSPND